MAYGPVNVPGSGAGSAPSVTTIEVPLQHGSLTYNGEVQAPMWDNYNPNAVTVTGESSGTNAGTYTAIFTPNPNFQWSDGSISQKYVTWEIQKAQGSLSLSATSVTLDLSNMTKTIVVTRVGDGIVSASSSNTNVATVSVSGTTVTIRGVAKGNATITISVVAGTNHNAPANKTVSVTSNFPDAVLGNNAPDVIQAAAKAGIAGNLWSVGDEIVYFLNGNIGELSFNGTGTESFFSAFVLGFNHNSSIEGNNTIHFQFGKHTLGVKTLAFVDSKYNTTGSDTAFRMNTTNTNTGGWSGSYMRKTICQAFLNALPTDRRNIIVACTKYSDNTGGGKDTASQVTSTSDKIWLLSEFEVQGKRSYANSAEQNYQKQYDYYKNGNSKIKYKHDDMGSACNWWLRSVNAANTTGFCYVLTGGGASAHNAYISLGFAPGFKVA